MLWIRKVRGDLASLSTVIPAKAGIHFSFAMTALACTMDPRVRGDDNHGFGLKPDRRHRLRRDAFAAPCKSKTFRRRRLHAHAAGVDAQDLRDPRHHGGAVRGDFGAFADDGDIEMHQRAASVAQQAMGVLNETVGRRAAPLRISGRKMLTDVAGANGAEEGVGGGMKRHVGVGMADKALAMGDAQTAEGYEIAVS